MNKRAIRTNNHAYIKFFSCLCATTGGILLASNIELSQFGFVPLALSSGSMSVVSILEKNRFNAMYSCALFLTVDLLGIYRWIIVG